MEASGLSVETKGKSSQGERRSIPKNCILPVQQSPALVSQAVAAVGIQQQGLDLTSGQLVSCGEVTLIIMSCRSGLCELNQGVINNLTTSVIYR